MRGVVWVYSAVCVTGAMALVWLVNLAAPVCFVPSRVVVTER